MDRNPVSAYQTLDDFVGNTPLVRLKRIPGRTSNVVLAKLEGNNPAGSVKDRPALSMIRRAEERGQIKPGDTLIEPTSGNTGIALAMVAAMRGYRMVLVMPEHLSVERRQTMAAFGARFVLTPKEGGMETARDIAEQMQARGEGLILDQFANPDNPLSHYEGTGPQGKGSRDPDLRLSADRGFPDSRHTQVAGGLPSENIRPHARGPGYRSQPGRLRGDDAPAGKGRGDFRRHLLRRRTVGGVAGFPGSGERYHRHHRLRPR